ncbi:MAG: PD40 domain-containing protein [Flavobacteriales bacterium]|nr:MAG: PD40 domain-containing protein [Flavobacteriales bacterium]
MKLFVRTFFVLVALLTATVSQAQFYNGSRQQFGKNRVQYQDFLWQQYKFGALETYFYKGGRDVARYTAISAHKHLKDLERVFDFALDERLQFVVYNSLTDFRQSNIGLSNEEQFNIGGVTRIVGTKIFVYNEGDRALLDKQVRSGIAQVMLDQMMYGGNWREVIRNSTLLNLPEWYTKGLVDHVGRGWDAETEMRIKDGVLTGRFDKFNRLEGDEAALAGHMIWRYVSDVYGESVVPNILYMTRVSRNAESGFLFVLGVSLKTLSEECVAYYRDRFTEQDRLRKPLVFDEFPMKHKRTIAYTQFEVSPNGRYAAWVSNELGRYKVFVYDISNKKRTVIARGEHRLNRIIDKSYPVLAWHPGSRGLSYIVERKGEPFMRTYSLDDKKTTVKPVLNVEKVLDLAYSPDGQTIVFSAVREGRTDLYLHYIIGNRQEQLTDDQWDDLDPRFTSDGTQLIFSSDRTDDTLRANGDVALTAGMKDIFLYDLDTRSLLLTRLSNTPSANETSPAAFDSASYTYLSDAGGTMNRWLVRYDSAVSHVDTTVHYRYFTRNERVTDFNRGALDQEVDARGGRYSELFFSEGKYRFHVGRTDEGRTAQQNATDPGAPDPRGTPGGGAVTDDMSPVLKVDPLVPRVAKPDEVDVSNYRFLGETDAPANGSGTNTAGNTVMDQGGTVVARVDSAQKAFAFPEQRNYNLNFTTDEVQSQVDNSYNNGFYQPINGADNLNPGLSGLIKMAVSDLFEDHKIVGGYRLALDLNNNDWMLQYINLKRRVDKDITFTRQAIQSFIGFNVVKTHTHVFTYRMTYPFNELSSVRLSLIERYDRRVFQSTDLFSLQERNQYDITSGVKLEYVFDSSLPRGLNLWTGWKAKLFGEYYRSVDENTGEMTVLGLDLRHSLRVHREIIWVNRLAGSSSIGARRVLFFLGGVDNWLFPRFDPSIPIDFTQPYFYQGLSTPVRGFFYNARNGNSFGVLNSELRVPIFRWLMNRPIRSDFLHNFQVATFVDAGAAWTGPDPYSSENTFNTTTYENNPLTITVDNQREPIVAGYGFGLRTRLLGYFVRTDWAWGIDDGVILDPVFYFSLSLDI